MTVLKRQRDYLVLAGLTVLALLIHGYHLGVEDQAIYLPGIRKDLNPSLYPHDSRLFLPQANATLFGRLVAVTVRYTHLPSSVVLFSLHVLALFLILVGCFKLAKRLFREPHAHWGAVCLVTSLMTLPVAGTALYMVDEYTDPRSLATIAILFALLAVFPGETPTLPVDARAVRLPQILWMLLWISAASLVHIQMAFYGALLLVFLLFRMPRNRSGLAIGAFAPLSSLWEPASAAWRKAARMHTEHYLLLWHWYEWLGLVAPLAVLAWFARLARLHQLTRVAYLSRRLFVFGLFWFAVGLIVTIPPAFDRLTPYQPLRGFHILYLLFILLAGGLAGKWILRKALWRWLVVFVPLSLTMFYVQVQLYPGNPHVEWPGVSNPNPWVEAFLWVRHNTPQDAYFALDPQYMHLPEEDNRGFRGIAERSQMADDVKDPGVVTLFPDVGKLWLDQVSALKGWKRFTAGDFRKLKERFGVNWVILQQPGVAGMTCPYQNQSVLVCRIGP